MIVLQQIAVGIGLVLAAFVGITLVVALPFMCCAVWHMMYVTVQEIYYRWRTK